MTTIENNKLIAEFMGLSEIAKTNGIVFKDNNTNEIHLIKYHSDWNWLMPVIEKIEGLNLGDKTIETVFSKEDLYINSNVSFLIMYKECYVNFFGEMKVYENWISITECNSKIEAVYTAVIEFIKWYNANK